LGLDHQAARAGADDQTATALARMQSSAVLAGIGSQHLERLEAGQWLDNPFHDSFTSSVLDELGLDFGDQAAIAIAAHQSLRPATVVEHGSTRAGVRQDSVVDQLEAGEWFDQPAHHAPPLLRPSPGVRRRAALFELLHATLHRDEHGPDARLVGKRCALGSTALSSSKGRAVCGGPQSQG